MSVLILTPIPSRPNRNLPDTDGVGSGAHLSNHSQEGEKVTSVSLRSQLINQNWQMVRE